MRNTYQLSCSFVDSGIIYLKKCTTNIRISFPDDIMLSYYNILLQTTTNSWSTYQVLADADKDFVYG